MRAQLIVLGLVPGLVLGLAGCSEPRAVRAAPERATPEVPSAPAPPAQDVLRTRVLGVMGTELQIEVIGPDAQELERAIDAAVAELRRVEDMMTSWRDSPVTRLNARAGEGPQVVPPELARLVARSIEISRATDGAFDVTFASAGKLWDFKRVPPLVPDPETIRAALVGVGFERVKLDLAANTIELPAGTAIGLGGIAKGYGVDRAMKVLLDRGIRHAFVNAGGDLKALGRKQGELWPVAIRHPRDQERVLAVVPVSNTCLVTSGDYERFFEVDGERYHHILDPRTGYPATGCMSATVLAPDAAFADALATAMCVLGPARGLAIVEALPDVGPRVEALLVGMDGEVHVTDGLRGVTPTEDR